MGKQGTRNVLLQPESWYAVQDTTVYLLEDADLHEEDDFTPFKR